MPMTLDAASAAVSSTTARLEYDITANTAPTSMSSSTSPVSEAKITLTPAAWVMGFVVSTIHCKAMMIRPSPTRMRPKHAAQVTAVEPQDVGAHEMRAPYEQRDAGKQIEEDLHR